MGWLRLRREVHLLSKEELLQIKIRGIGDPSTGFVKGKYGPFRCDHCDWMDKDSDACNNPAINSNTQLTDRADDGRVQVDANDCSNHFWPEGLDPAQYAKDEKLDVRSPHGFPAISMTVLKKHIGKK